MTIPSIPTNLVVNNLLNTVNTRKHSSVLLTWDNNTETDIVSYNVYRSYIPYGVFNKIANVTVNTYTDDLTFSSTPSVPGDIGGINQAINGMWYYQVTAVNSLSEESLPTQAISYIEYEAFDTNPFSNSIIVGNSSYLYSPDSPFDMPDNEDLKEYFERIRAYNVWMLIQNGRDVLLFKRLKEGTKCPHWDDDNQQCPYPLGKSENMEDACYGTGIIGGYYPPLNVKFRIVSALSKIVINREGMVIDNKPRSWTIWSPNISNFDFIVTSAGDRYEITEVNSYEARGGLVTHQDCVLIKKWPTDLIYRVPVPSPLRS